MPCSSMGNHEPISTARGRTHRHKDSADNREDTPENLGHRLQPGDHTTIEASPMDEPRPRRLPRTAPTPRWDSHGHRVEKAMRHRPQRRSETVRTSTRRPPRTGPRDLRNDDQRVHQADHVGLGSKVNVLVAPLSSGTDFGQSRTTVRPGHWSYDTFTVFLTVFQGQRSHQDIYRPVCVRTTANPTTVFREPVLKDWDRHTVNTSRDGNRPHQPTKRKAPA